MEKELVGLGRSRRIDEEHIHPNYMLVREYPLTRQVLSGVLRLFVHPHPLSTTTTTTTTATAATTTTKRNRKGTEGGPREVGGQLKPASALSTLARFQ